MSGVGVVAAGGVALVTLDRPEKRNALSIEMRRELARALAEAAGDAEVRCTVITGRGEAFCAGMDVTQFGGDDANRRALVESSEVMVDALLEHPKPLVAAVNGPARGGGFVLALLCDVRVAGPSASFGFPEVERGIPASYGAARAVLARGVAADLCLTGRTIDAEEALRLGVVSEVTRHPLQTAERIAALPPRGIGMAREWLRREPGFRALLEEERAAFRAAVL